MAAEKEVKLKTVTVEALEDHTYNGESYAVGDTYDIDEQLVDSVTFQGKAVRVDRVAHAKSLRPDASGKLKPAKPAKGRKAGKKR